METIKELVYDCLHIPWLKGEFMSDFAPEWAGSYVITLQKASGDIRGIVSVEIWRRVKGHVIMQVTQKTTVKTCIDTYTNFKQLTLSKDTGPSLITMS